MTTEQELDKLHSLLTLLDEQDLLVYDLQKGQVVGVSEASEVLNTTIARIYASIQDSFPNLVPNFKPSKMPIDVRSQTRLARGTLQQKIRELTSQPPAMGVDRRRVFVVHGRNEKLREAMFTFLRAINLDPMEWGQVLRSAAGSSPHIDVALTKAFNKANAWVVLLSGDDLARLHTSFLKPSDGPEERNLTPQARPNVFFEAGMAFGRLPSNVVLVKLGHVRSFSDVAGRHIPTINNSVAARQDLAERLHHVGCDVDIKSKTEWHTAGDFDAATISPEISTVPTLTIVSRAYSSQPGKNYENKVYVEIRNDSGHSLNVRNLGWTPVPHGITINYSATMLQIKIANEWCPVNYEIDHLWVGPTERLRTWFDADSSHNSADLQTRCRQIGKIAQLELLANDIKITLAV